MKRCCFVFALIYCFAKTVVFAQTIPHPLPTDELPVVYVLGTGGTIAGAGSTRIAGNYDPSKVTIQDIIKLLPELTQIADVRTEQVCMVSSQDMTEKLWLALAKRVNELLAQPQVRGVVITHGTDTMEETAYFLSLTVKSDKAVVLVGSMRPPTSLSPDGPLNLFQAVLLATKPEAQKLGVLVAMNGKIFDAREVTKTHTTAWNLSKESTTDKSATYSAQLFNSLIALHTNQPQILPLTYANSMLCRRSACCMDMQLQNGSIP